MSAESQALRDAIRAGELSADIDRDKWERAVNRIYEIERSEETDHG
jgi:hypothetical protein